ncbi:MAG TPA: glucose-6-phosphate isomerase, partial [Gammaproteobacteria bacterium]|nr:glucose-6-phosphate isomerase [Gammaproteobacteria bacterium]
GLLTNLAKERALGQAIKGLFSGERLNRSEDRPALHTALRLPPGEKFILDGKDISGQVHRELDRVQEFVNRLRGGEVTGPSGKPIDTLVNLGIGGSDLGPRMVHRALATIDASPIKVHFVANIDAGDILSVLNRVDPETTMFVLSSKSCTTKETLTNADTALQWLRDKGCEQPENRFLAVTANPAAALERGIAEESIFNIREWVGGRYSLWSAIGLPLAAAIGMEKFRELLAGAHAMDEHFRTVPLHRNIPVILGLLDIWYMNLHKTECTAVVPYSESLALLPDHLCQLFMESNGKRVTQDDKVIDYQTSPVILGGTGTRSQHAFFQLLHQGTRLIPVDFIITLGDELDRPEHHRQLFANCLAQAEALMHGSSDPGKSASRHCPGNRPSTLLVLDALTPENLGRLIALYEHRVFVQGRIWDINSFDQWGVELGKKIATGIDDELGGPEAPDGHDASTRQWIERYRKINR